LIQQQLQQQLQLPRSRRNGSWASSSWLVLRTAQQQRRQQQQQRLRQQLYHRSMVWMQSLQQRRL
jgi:hypothetical protein